MSTPVTSVCRQGGHRYVVLRKKKTASNHSLTTRTKIVLFVDFKFREGYKK